MGVYGGPEIPNDGLVLALDGANYKSFKGESVTNLYYADAASSANNSIFHMPMGGTATGSYTTSSYGSWSGNTIFKVIVSAGTLSGGYESFRACVSGSFTSTYGTSRRLSAKVKMLKGSITSLGLHNGGGTSGHDSGHYTPISEFSVPTDVLSKDGWYQFDVDVSGSYPFGHCVGIGIVGSDIEFLVTEMMLYPSLTFVRFTPTTRGTTVATGGGWADLTGNGNHGELVNGVRESSANGGSLTFDGSDDYVYGTVPYTGNTNVTITGFAEITLGTAGCIIKVGDGCAGYSMGIGGNSFIDNGNNIVGLYSCIRWISTGVSWNSGWNGFAMVIDGSGNASFYKNGFLVASSNGSAPAAVSGSYYLGRCVGDESSGSERAFEGKLASVKIYNRALTAAEISQNYNALRGRFGI